MTLATAKQVVALERERTYLRAALAHGGGSGRFGAAAGAVGRCKLNPVYP